MDQGRGVAKSMETVIVKPIRQRGELLFVTLSTLAILLVAGGLIYLRSKAPETQTLKSYQISAFSSLPQTSQGVFMDLYTSGFDIEAYHRRSGEVWPEVQTLEATLVPPFEKSAVWESRGRIKWILYRMDKDNVHRAAYIGKSSDTAAAGSFIIIFEHFHTLDGAYFSGVNKKTPFNIWYKPGGFILPRDFSEGTLIATGWREAIPYRGTDELKKLNRGK
jgi:hypothetical protein